MQPKTMVERDARKFGVLLLMGLCWSLSGLAQEATSKPSSPVATKEILLTEPRAKHQADGSLPKGWDQTRLERADGLYFDGQRLTVRELIEALRAGKKQVDQLLIKVAPRVHFRRLQGVAQVLNNANLGITTLKWASTDQPRRTFPLVFIRSSMGLFRFENGRLVFEGGFGTNLGEEVRKTLEDAAKKIFEAEKDRLPMRLELKDNQDPKSIDWWLNNKHLKSEKHNERIALLQEEVRNKKEEAGSVTLALAPNHSIMCGDLVPVYIAAKNAGAQLIAITNASESLGLGEFSWTIRGPRWLPRVINQTLMALAKTQAPGGSWPTSRRGDITRLGSTALALLAFLGEFHTPEEGQYKDNVAGALQFLRSKQRADGSIIDETSGFSFDHVLATYALVEAYGLTGDDELEEAAGPAFRFLMRCRNKEGVWGKTGAGAKADLVVTAWCVCVLKSAQDSGFDLPEDAFAKISKWLDSVVDSKKGSIASRSKSGRVTTLVGLADEFYGRHTESLTAIGLMMKARCGAKVESDKTISLGVNRLLQAPPRGGDALGLPDLDYLFFGALTMNAFDGPHWDGWRPGLNDAVQGYINQSGGGEKGTVKKMMKADATVLSMVSLCLELSYRYAENHKDN